MNAEQCRMARAGLGIGVRDLATAAQVSTNTVTRFEAGEELRPRTIQALKAALEAAGIIFLDAGVGRNGGPGVRLRDGNSGETIPLEDLSAANDE